MSTDALKYKIKGNESFSIREGWLAKGLMALEENKYVFSEETAMDHLGVGSKMVKSIKYWLLASHLVEEKREKNAKHSLVPSKDFGEVVKKYDPYFEDVFTLWIIHYYISSDIEFNTVWNLFFNRFNVTDFTKVSMVDKVVDECNKLYNKGNSLYNSIDSDCGVLLKMYTASEETITDPEENLISPFSELGLISRGSERSSYMKVRPLYSKLDRLAVLYIMIANLPDDKISVDIDTLLSQDNNVGKVLNLDRNMINEYLDRLRQEGFIELNRTAGLDMVYINKKLSLAEILELYYTQNETEV
jgi:hypothetical protein